jgi:CRISPR-associated endonuclease/helicase Cas3
MLLDEPWAKTNTAGETRSLIAHCSDVAIMAREILARSVMRQRLESALGLQLSPVHLDRLAVVAGLHDLGKALKGFQDRLIGEPFHLSPGHVAEGLAALSIRNEVQQAINLPLLRRWFTSATEPIFAAVCHHGAPASDEAIRRARPQVPALLGTTAFGHDPATEMGRLAEALVARFPEALAEAPTMAFGASAQHLWAGIVMTADWMASGYAFDAGDRQALAEKLLADAAWSGWYWGSPAGEVLQGRSPRPAQEASLELPLTERLVVVEAPTGTGKTEAALIWASRLVEAGLVDGLYFAVPTRSAAMDLHRRIAAAMVSAHPALAGKVVRAVPGMLDTDERPDYPAETWAVAAPKRVFAAPVAVGTIDQALLSIVRSKHAWMRAAMLSRHLLVIDEVHASDPYMAALTRALIDRHLMLGSHVLAMSATLGETALAALQRRPCRAISEAIAIAYPAIRTGAADIALTGAAPKVYRLELRQRQDALQEAADAAGRDQAVLMIRSTVGDAVADFLSLSALGVPTMLHHSRYALVDRTHLDVQLLKIFGLGGRRRGIVAVATQTAEQSLDIDADLLITDACPADVLLQRLGRLHRHRSDTIAHAIVIDPGRLDRFIQQNGRPRGEAGQGWPWVYSNLLAVDETLQWIESRGEIVVPRDSRHLVEQATHADHLEDLAIQRGGRWETLWRWLYQGDAIKEQLGAAGLVDWTRPYREAQVNEWIATRLVDATVTVATPGLRSPFLHESIEAMPVPARWLAGAGAPDQLSATVEGSCITLGGVTMIYDRLGLRRAA